MTLGGKYKEEKNFNPPPGAYDVDKSKELVGTKIRSALIRPDTSPYRRPKESNPDPGKYDAHLKPFGSDTKKFTMGGKYKWKPDDNPPIGGYDVDRGLAVTSF